MVIYRNLDQKQVRAVARQLASSLKTRGAIIGLSGPLGSGKTTFVKAFAAALGIKKILSPTFVIRHDHALSGRNLYHLDFYRLRKPAHLLGLGLDEILSGRHLVLIEWVEKFPLLKQRCDILITFKIKPHNLRDVTIRTKK